MEEEWRLIRDEVLVEIELRTARNIDWRIDPEDARGDLVDIRAGPGIGYDWTLLRGWFASISASGD